MNLFVEALQKSDPAVSGFLISEREAQAATSEGRAAVRNEGCAASGQRCCGLGSSEVNWTATLDCFFKRVFEPRRGALPAASPGFRVRGSRV